MSTTTVPPQAYTRDVLSKAFNWLQKQPPEVRAVAKTPDTLVGLYLRSQRTKEEGKSATDFKNELKNLAGQNRVVTSSSKKRPPENQMALDETIALEEEPASEPAPYSEELLVTEESARESESLRQLDEEAWRQQLRAPQDPVFRQRTSSSSQPRQESFDAERPSRPAWDVFISSLDIKSQRMLRELKEELNLSSEKEVLRLLINLGYKKIRPILRPML